MRLAALYRTYAFGVKLLGFERGLARFLTRLDLQLPPDAAVLDVGCATGIMGLTLMKRASRSTLVATDVNRDLLEEARLNAIAHGIDRSRVTLGVSDVSRPEVVTRLDGMPLSLTPGMFDIVATGAVVGYARDQERSLHTLLDLIKPGGYFLNVEMDETVIGRLVSRRYHYPVMPLARMEHLIAGHGFTVTRVPVKTFPPRLTRTCYVARRA
jgi:demethylmenaquinone methyltransferase/2-methoxy-6-polyprenyl-1,4-benzoquinol methylase